jgi:glycosyltransferase involved in cell wall biosynthesis
MMKLSSINMKRIGFVSTLDPFPWAGSEELWSQTARRMAEFGYRVGINVFSWENEACQVKELSQTENCEVYRRPKSTSLWQRSLNKVFTPEQLNWADFHMQGWLKRFQPDLVAISTGAGFDGKEWMQACQKQDIPYVIIVQLADIVFWPDSETVKEISDLFARAKAVFFVSKHNLENFSKLFARNLDNATVTYNPLNLNLETKVDWPEDSSTLHLACVARIGIEHKGQDILLEVMSQPKWRNRPITVTLFGDGHHKGIMQNLKNFWQLDNIIFGGFAEDIASVWSKHHALVLPSRYEGLPLAVVEAMTCQRICIVTDVGGNSDLIEDGISGFVASAPTTRIFEETLDRAWERQHEWQQMGENAARRVREIIPRDPVANFVKELESVM